MITITGVEVIDLRFPTSQTADGSDAMNKDGDYSAAYVILRTDDPLLSGHGFTFTIGRGNDLCVEAARQRALPLIGRDVAELVADLGGVYRELQSDSQLRWLGPEKGVIHLALAAVMNAVWDLAARVAGQAPLASARGDVVRATRRSRRPALPLRRTHPRGGDRAARAPGAEAAGAHPELERAGGYPAYTTSAGWLGYSDEKLRRLLQEAVDQGYQHVKLKVGGDVDEDIRRLRIARDVIGWDAKLMIDANQVWDVPEAITWIGRLAEFKPHWIEEPTSPDDVLGHAAIRAAVAPIGVATGEHGMNRVLFKQLFQAGAIDFCQLDACRLGSVNEVLAVLLLAAKFDVPVCPHAGGVGLCELVQHLSIFDFVAVSGSLEDRVTEYVDHLHEHFVEPCIVEDGRYVLPRASGYSAEIHTATIDEFRFPDGSFWAAEQARAAAPVVSASV